MSDHSHVTEAKKVKGAYVVASAHTSGDGNPNLNSKLLALSTTLPLASTSIQLPGSIALSF